MQLSTAERALYVKLVYYGPGLSGKTTNLQTIHRLTHASRRRPLVSLRTEGDRTLFFDLLSLELGQLFGVDVRVKLYTVPGQIQYDSTRRQVLAGADGVVFVADSSPNQRSANAMMIRRLKTHLQANGLGPDSLPLVFQWNKRDLPELMAPAEMDRELNWRHAPAFCAVATTGAGVLETFEEIAALTLENLAAKAQALRGQPMPTDIRSRVQAACCSLTVAPGKGVAGGGPPARPRAGVGPGRGSGDQTGPRTEDFAAEPSLTPPGPPEGAASALSREQLLARAQRERQAILTLCRAALAAADADGLLRVMLRTALSALQLPAGSVLQTVKPRAALREVAVVGSPGDPLNAVQSAGVGSVATSLLAKGELLLCCDVVGELLFGQPHPAVGGLRAVVSAPICPDPPGGALLLLYGDANSRDFDKQDIEFVATMAAITTLALKNLLVRAD